MPEQAIKAFGEAIRQARSEMRLSQQDLSDLTGISKRHIAKIENGIIQSCHKRPVSTQQISKVIDEIENELFTMEEKEIPTSVIGEKVMRKLKDLDEVAYVRFASVYREFKDVNTFVEEIGKLLKSNPEKKREET